MAKSNFYRLSKANVIVFRIAVDLIIMAIFSFRLTCANLLRFATAFDGPFNMREYTTLAIFHWFKRSHKQYTRIVP